jgi:polar amino acid transport system permease protein
MSIDPELKPGELVPTPGGAYKFDRREFPWWLVVMILIIAALVVAIVFDPAYREAFTRIFPIPFAATQGIMLTLYITVGSFVVAIFLGLIIGLARLSKRALIRNAAAVYIEFIRGIPMLVFIFAIAFFIAPDFSEIVGQERGWVPQVIRASAALSFFYAAFIAEVFRAGIQSVDRTQSEAGRALGLTERQITRRVVLPQAVRNMLPALGNDLISLMKDTSLVSVLAVREMTQLAKLYSGSTFRFRETYLILMVIYVILTLSLSLLLRWYERKIAIPGRGLQSA